MASFAGLGCCEPLAALVVLAMPLGVLDDDERDAPAPAPAP